MKRIVFVIAALVVAFGLVAGADAAAGKRGKSGRMAKGCESGTSGGCSDGSMMMSRIKELGLDEKQTEAVKAIHYRTKKEIIRKRADLQTAELELREIVTKDPVDLRAAEARLKQISDMKADLMMTHLKAREECKALLTPEQRKKFSEMMGSMGMRHGRCEDCGMMHGKGSEDDGREMQGRRGHKMRHSNKGIAGGKKQIRAASISGSPEIASEVLNFQDRE